MLEKGKEFVFVTQNFDMHIVAVRKFFPLLPMVDYIRLKGVIVINSFVNLIGRIDVYRYNLSLTAQKKTDFKVLSRYEGCINHYFQLYRIYWS